MTSLPDPLKGISSLLFSGGNINLERYLHKSIGLQHGWLLKLSGFTALSLLGPYISISQIQAYVDDRKNLLQTLHLVSLPSYLSVLTFFSNISQPALRSFEDDLAV